MANDIGQPDADRPAHEFASVRGREVDDSIFDPADIVARGRARPVIDDRPYEEMLGYGNDGLPR